MFSKTPRPTHTKPSMISRFSMIPAAAVLLAAFAWQAGANASRPPAQPTAIATVDIVSIIDKLEERLVREAELEQSKASRQAQLDEVIENLKAIQADLEFLEQGTNERKEKIRQAMETQAVVKARGDALNQILSIDRGNVTKEMYGKITEAISRIADREGYDIVLFDDSLFSVPSDVPFADVYRSIVTKSVIYKHESVDITEQVITLMNNEYTAP
tara:strand:- start:69665 stop:70309 length:645 start_codon:yes stop_codon:yes gene_type:complete